MSGSPFEDQIWDNIERNSGGINDDGYPDNSYDDNANVPVQEEKPDSEEIRRRVESLIEPENEEQPRRQIAKQPQQGQPKDPKDKNPRTDAKGNVIDENGQVIARGGAERRLAQTNERLRTSNESLSRRNQELEAAVNEYKMLDGLPKALNLNNDDVKQGLTIVADFIQNPAKAARDVIALALSRGVTMQQIVNDELIPDINLRAVNNLLEERLGPVARNLQQSQEVDEAQRAATQEFENFMGDFPLAQVHGPVVAKIMDDIRTEYKDRGRAIPSAYHVGELAMTRLQNFATANGFNLEEDLQPQIDARLEEVARQKANPQGNGPRSPNANVRQTQPRQQTTQRHPMPNGSRGGAVPKHETSAAPDLDSGEIVRWAMRENGYSI